ncbi:MAG: transposase [Acidimicrobiia bacterium]|nr:transposase [Acidimicrobiia bacterium]
MFRDAVRSTARRVVYASGLNLVVITLRVSAPWGRCPIGVPINVRLHRKNDPTTTVAHAAAMIRELAGWLPERSLHLCADGAYASLAGAALPRTHITSRMRRDAALYEPAPPHRPTRPSSHQRRTTGHPTPTRHPSAAPEVEAGERRRPRPHRRTARACPRRALVQGQQG